MIFELAQKFSLMNQSNISKYKDELVHFISGLLAGFISVTVCNPLDIARTRLNVLNAPSHHSKSNKYTHFSHAMSTIWKQQGLRGFYSGYRTNVVAIPLFHSIFFPIYEYSKKKMDQMGYNASSSTLGATFTAGSISNIITNPIWVVRTRLMVQYLHPQSSHYHHTAPFKVMKEMIKQEGVRSLFKGLSASLLSVSNAVVYFYIYEKLKLHLSKNNEISVINIFISSTASKIAASSITYPLIVIRTVMHDFRGYQKSHLLGIIKHIWKENGLWGFYGGLKPDLIRLIPSNAILFIVYEQLKRYL